MRSLSGAAGRAQITPVKPLAQPPRRPIQAPRIDGCARGASLAGGPPSSPALPSHPGPRARRRVLFEQFGRDARGGVVVNLDDDDNNFERFSMMENTGSLTKSDFERCSSVSAGCAVAGRFDRSSPRS